MTHAPIRRHRCSHGTGVANATTPVTRSRTSGSPASAISMDAPPAECPTRSVLPPSRVAASTAAGTSSRPQSSKVQSSFSRRWLPPWPLGSSTMASNPAPASA